LGLFAAAAALVWSVAASAPNIDVHLENGSFKLTGWSVPRLSPVKGWASVFVVFAGAGDVPPLLGSYSVEGDSLIFRPRFPLEPGVRYRAVFRAPGAAPFERIFDLPAKDKTPSTHVERVYPSADILPSNLLRLYVYFSAPMSQGESGQRMHLLDEKGKELPAVFLPGEELWDPRFQRLTMTFDPGRIKRGLTSNTSMGPPLVEGRRYTLVIDRDWPDARGVPMVAGFRKSFRGGPGERTPPDPNQWRISAPKAGTIAAVAVDFPTPMNYVLLQRMLQVFSGRESVSGTVAVERVETRWLFTPRAAWRAGDYRLVVDTAIEDLAGNRIGQAFDIDVFERVTEHIAASTISLPFRVRPAE
jgi:hypothetical protein